MRVKAKFDDFSTTLYPLIEFPTIRYDPPRGRDFLLNVSDFRLIYLFEAFFRTKLKLIGC